MEIKRTPRFAVTCRTCGQILAHGEITAEFAKRRIEDHRCPDPKGAQTTILGP